MAISGIAAATSYQTMSLPETSSAHRRHGNQPSSISDVDAQSGSVAAPNKPAGRPGGLVDITA